MAGGLPRRITKVYCSYNASKLVVNTDDSPLRFHVCCLGNATARS